MQGRLMPWVLDGVDLGDSALEIGPGPGLSTDWLRPRVPRLTTIEVDERLAQSLKRRMDGTNVEAFIGKNARGQIDDPVFDDKTGAQRPE